jgi:hypothetical protein
MNNEVRVRISGDASGVKKATREASQSLSGLADDAKSRVPHGRGDEPEFGIRASSEGERSPRAWG